MTENLKAKDVMNDKLALLSAWIESQMAYKGLPGLAIGIVYDQELVWAKGFGFADVGSKKPVTTQTIFRIASITKLFTSTALLQLRDAGKLQMDDPVVKHLPWFSIKSKDPDTPPVLLRHLITHTSGMPRESASPYWSTAEFPTYEEVEKALPNQELAYRPETRWKYSNLALSIAGDVVAAVSGMSYEDYVQQNILEPLGMKNTFVHTIDEQHPLFATGYGRRLPDHSRALRPFGDCKGISPAANMSTNVEDLAKFAMLQFSQKKDGETQIVSPHTLTEMHTVKWLDPNWQVGWGWGFMVMRIQEKTYIGHGGSLMGFRTNLMLNPEDKVGVIVLTNADDGDPMVYSQKAFDWVGPAVVKAFGEKPAAKKADPAWEQFTGKYRSPWGDTQIMVLEGELVAISPNLDDPTVDILKLTPEGENTFRMEMKAGFGAPGEMASFELGEDGKVKRLVMGMNYSYPVENW